MPSSPFSAAATAAHRGTFYAWPSARPAAAAASAAFAVRPSAIAGVLRIPKSDVRANVSPFAAFAVFVFR